MEEYQCAFNATLMSDQFGCAHARHVVRRGGPDVACVDSTGHERCRRLFEILKASALPAFGVEDDLLSMPHSTLVKIQFGGLLGIQRLLGSGGEAADAPAHMPKRAREASRDTVSARGPRLGNRSRRCSRRRFPTPPYLPRPWGRTSCIHAVVGPIAETVMDINSLVEHAGRNFGDLETLPCHEFLADITSYKTRRRK